ncbi:MAG: hypothetical protein WBH08_01840 [Methanothrix sp.]|uniref:hypothetical protein n=1 Tax=Methanothrix sp. TaxID=90426 RepID=UPI003BB7B6F8
MILSRCSMVSGERPVSLEVMSPALQAALSIDEALGSAYQNKIFIRIKEHNKQFYDEFPITEKRQ